MRYFYEYKYKKGNRMVRGHNLEKIELPSSLEYIDAKAFDVCTKLTSVVYLGSKEEWQNHPEFTDAIPQQAILTFKKNK